MLEVQTVRELVVAGAEGQRHLSAATAVAQWNQRVRSARP
jgi:hypothetical protein